MPSYDATKKTVEWTRPGRDPPNMYVKLLQVGHIRSEHQNPMYSQRASLFDEELFHGNISLQIFRVQLEDEGTFQCLCVAPNLHSNTLIQLRVGAVSQPVISSAGPKDHGLSLMCDTGCWYPEPEVSWLDSEGNHITADSSEKVRDSHNCSAVQSNVTVRQTGNVTCRVHLPHINHTVETQYVISELPIPPEGGLTGGVIVTITTVILSAALPALGALVAFAVSTALAPLVALAAFAYRCWKKKQPSGGVPVTQKNSVKGSLNHTNSEDGDRPPTEALHEESTQV